MRKGLIFVLSFLCFVLMGCAGNGSKKETQGYEDVLVDYSQRILFVSSEVSYSNGYQNRGYFVMGDGARYFYDLSGEDGKYAETGNLYEYLTSHVSDFYREDFLSAAAVKKCIGYLYAVDKGAEIKTETVYAGGGQCDLYGVWFEADVPEFVWLGAQGSVKKELLDENAGRILEVLGVEWAFVNRESKMSPPPTPTGTPTPVPTSIPVPTKTPVPTSTPVPTPTPVTLQSLVTVLPAAQENRDEDEFLYPIKYNEMYGVINQYGEVIVEPVYASVSGFSEGMASVSAERGGKYGYINTEGELVIPMLYKHAYDFSEGLAAVWEGGRAGYIDKTGVYVIEPQFGWSAGPFSEGLAAVKDDLYAFVIDKEGQVVFEPKYYTIIGDFHDGRASVQMTGGYANLYGYIDTNFELVIEPITNGLTRDLPVSDFSEGFGIMYVERDEETAKKVYVDVDGNILGGYQFDLAFDFSDGLAYAERDGISGYIDTTGEFVLTEGYQGTYRDGLLRKVVDGKIGFMNRSGEMIIEPVYDNQLAEFENGYGIVTLGEDVICISKTGEEMWRIPIAERE